MGDITLIGKTFDPSNGHTVTYDVKRDGMHVGVLGRSTGGWSGVPNGSIWSAGSGATPMEAAINAFDAPAPKVLIAPYLSRQASALLATAAAQARKDED